MIIDTVRQQLVEALKAQAKTEATALRSLIAALEYKRMQKNVALTEDEEIAAVKSEVKKRQEAIAIYKEHQEPERAATEEAELKVLEKFLPTQVSEDEVRAVIKELREQLGDTADRGQLIGRVIGKFGKGTVDGSLVARLVNEK